MKIRRDSDIYNERRDAITDCVTEAGNNPVYLDGFEGGLCAYEIDDDGNVHAVYSEELMLEYYSRVNECSDEDAYDFYSFNTLRSLPYIEEKNRPRIIHTFP